MTLPLLRDRHGRSFESLRLSVTDRCNFRCRYCMPREEMVWFPQSGVLTFEEIERVVRIGIRLGLRRVRLTGGEPLLRKDLPILVRKLTALKGADGIRDLALTTNGVRLPAMAGELRDAGVDRVTISLDTLRRDRFLEITRRDEFGRVLEAIEVAARFFGRVKLNAVIVAGINDDEAVDFARYARDTGHSIRFIEYMPLDGGSGWSSEKVVPGAVLRARIESVHPLRPAPVEHAAQPSRNYHFADGSPGEIGFINPVTEPFCGTCDRMRLTADGKLKNCMFDPVELDLLAPLRSGFSDTEIAEKFLRSAEAKGPGGLLELQEAPAYAGLRNMSRLGG